MCVSYLKMSCLLVISLFNPRPVAFPSICIMIISWMLAFYVVLHFFLPIKTHIDHEMVFCCAPILEIRYFLQCILYQLYQNNVGMNCHHSSFSLRNFSFYSLDVVCCCVVFSLIFCLCFCEFNLMIKSLHIDAICTGFAVEFEKFEIGAILLLQIWANQTYNHQRIHIKKY